MPYSLVGQWHGISLLFPMEKLFERFVAGWLNQNVASDVKVRTQAATEYLCFQQGERIFRLEPDILLESATRRWVLDTKWKRLDGADRANNYGLSQADIYQLFAYGMKYLGKAGGDLALVFPRTRRFQEPLPPFDLGHNLVLHVLPFDLFREELDGFIQASIPLRSHLLAHQRAVAA
jgi:5-methylcytosine-specific restriction enzyme subunit McrC